MHRIQMLFTQGQQLFAQGQFVQAYSAFEKCTLMMPTLSEAWENMAVCLVNQGSSIKTVKQTLLTKVPKGLHPSILLKIASLNTHQASSVTHHTLLQQFKLPEAVDAFTEAWNNGTTTEDDAVIFIRGLFIAHEHLAKKQGQMHLTRLLNAWKDTPSIQYCLDCASKRVQSLIVRSQSKQPNVQSKDIELLETLGLIHYTYTNYENAAFCFQTLFSLTSDNEKKQEYRSHLSTCYSLNAQYKEALEIDPDNITAWERHDPTNHQAFRAQSLRLIRAAKRIDKECLPYWPTRFIHHRDSEIVIAHLQNTTVCGHDPMVFDNDFVYAGNRGTFRLAKPNIKQAQSLDNGIVVFATNPNNHYHLLIEFCAKVLAADAHLPYDVPIYIPTSNLTRVQEMIDRLGVKRPIKSFSVHENLMFKSLFVVDVSHVGHFSTHPTNLWDCYLTQGRSLQRLAKQFLNPKEIASTTNTDNLFIYAKRGVGARSFNDPENQIEHILKQWTDEHGLELVIFEGKRALTEQMSMFQRCRILFGIHGAAFTNLLFTPTECTIVEIPIHGNCNTLFQELSTLMNRTHIVCDVSCEYQGVLTVTPSVLHSVKLSLNKTMTQQR
jgi:tetratricopeptide (TPR) repeat protein